MQINTDLSPVISPKSNISSSFTSPKDSLLPTLNFNQIRPQNSNNPSLDFQFPKQPFPKNDKSPTGSCIPVITNQNNTTTTNESYSIEKNTYLETSNRDSRESSNSEILILQGNSIEAEDLNDEDDDEEEEMTKNHNQPIHILEYEEFVLNENNNTSIAKDYFAEKSSNSQRPKPQKITFPQNILPATSEPIQEPIKDQQPTELPRTNHIDDFQSGNKSNEVVDLQFKPGNEEVGSSSRRSNNEEKNIKAFENKPRGGLGNKRNLKPLDVTEEAEDDLKNYKQENSILKKEAQELARRVEELLKENAQLKQERELSQKAEKINTGRESERILREKEEIKNKFLVDENRALRDNQNKYQAIINEKDEQIHKLRLDNEEISKNSKNELYISLVDKVRVLKEKANQSTKQIEEQVEVIESKNIAIENLLFKMEKLTDSLTQKTNQVTELKEEIEKLKANAKESSVDYKAQAQPKNVGSLYAKIRDKEKYWFSPEKRPETSDSHYRKSYSPTNSQSSERKASRPNSSTAKSKETNQKGVIKLSTINQDMKSIDDQYSKSNHWSTLKWNMLNQRDKLEKETAEKNQNLYKKMKNRSTDHYTHSKNDSKNDSKSSSKNESRGENKKNTQNIEDLQKRLAYLKYKRMEFEKKKHDDVSSKEDMKAASDILATTTSFAESSKYPASKQLDSLISPSRNLIAGRYRESSMNKEDDFKKNENYASNQIHTYKAAQKAVPVYKSIELNSDVDMSYAMKNLKTSFTSKHQIHAKIDNYTSTPSQGHHHHLQQAEDDFKNPGRYHSYSNVSKFFNKISENSKSYKRSYDLSSHSKIPEIRSNTEASTKNKVDFFK